MMESEILKFIRDEIKKQLNIILSGAAGSNDQFKEDIVGMFPGMSTITDRPVMHPFGLSSRAPDGTISVTARQGDHFANRLILGHRDKNRPSLQKGEVMLYNESGQKVYLKNGQILVGSEESDENMVLGKVFQEFMSDVLQLIAEHTHIGNLGYDTSPPKNVVDFVSKKASPIDDGLILSDKVFTEK